MFWNLRNFYVTKATYVCRIFTIFLRKSILQLRKIYWIIWHFSWYYEIATKFSVVISNPFLTAQSVTFHLFSVESHWFRKILIEISNSETFLLPYKYFSLDYFISYILKSIYSFLMNIYVWYFLKFPKHLIEA